MSYSNVYLYLKIELHVMIDELDETVYDILDIYTYYTTDLMYLYIHFYTVIQS